MKKARLAFSGSGFLAGIHAGAASALMDCGYKIIEVAGTSGGSIVAAAVALGMNKDELRSLAVDSDMSVLLRFTPTAVFSKSPSYCNGRSLLEWLERQFDGALLSQVKIPLKILATDVGAGESYEFNSSMNVSIALACRASSAVPLVYAPVTFKGKTLVDGGVCNNIPVDHLQVDLNFKKIPRIGVAVDEPDTFDVAPIWRYAASLVKLLLAANENNIIHIESSTGAKILPVSAGGAGFLNTRLPTEVRQKLYADGYGAMKRYLVAARLASPQGI